jgi:hypothetical protein
MIKDNINDSNIRVPHSGQRTYKGGIENRLSRGGPPNFLSIRAIDCMYFGRMGGLERRLKGTPWRWMLGKDVVFHSTSCCRLGKCSPRHVC